MTDYKNKSISDAYAAGEIDKDTRNYMLADTLATWARNTGRDIGNVGAQFTGGTIDNNYDKSMWQNRNEQLAKNAVTSEMNKQEGSNASLAYDQGKANLTGANLANELSNKKLIMPREYEKLLRNAESIDNGILKAAVKGSAITLLNQSVNGGEISLPQVITAIVAEGGNGLAQAAAKEGKSVEEYVKDLLSTATAGLGTNVNISANIGNPLDNMFGGGNSNDVVSNELMESVSKADDEAQRNGEIPIKNMKQDEAYALIWDKLTPEAKAEMGNNISGLKNVMLRYGKNRTPSAYATLFNNGVAKVDSANQQGRDLIDSKEREEQERAVVSNILSRAQGGNVKPYLYTGSEIDWNKVQRWANASPNEDRNNKLRPAAKSLLENKELIMKYQ